MKVDPGIYRITNIVTGESYVGQAKSVRKRIIIHLHELRTGGHGNVRLQDSYNQYGDAAFVAELVESQPSGLCVYNQEMWLNSREGFYLNEFAPTFNDRLAPEAEVGWTIEGHAMACACNMVKNSTDRLAKITSLCKAASIADVKLAMKELSQKERLVIDRVYFVGSFKSMAAIGRELEKSGQWVTNIHASAIRRMSELINAHNQKGN